MSPQVPETAEVTAESTTTAPVEAKTSKSTAKKSSTKKPTAKASSNGKELPHGINSVQADIVKFLAKHENKGYSLKQISDGAKVSYANLTAHVGSLNEDKRRVNDKKFPCLITLGLIKYGPSEDGTSGTTYMIAAKGKTAATKL